MSGATAFVLRALTRPFQARQPFVCGAAIHPPKSEISASRTTRCSVSAADAPSIIIGTSSKRSGINELQGVCRIINILSTHDAVQQSHGEKTPRGCVSAATPGPLEHSSPSHPSTPPGVLS